MDSIHVAYASGALSCAALVQGYLDRIAAYDRRGPSLRALLTIHPEALQIAQRLDRQYRDDGGRVGSLHGIPVILKDNIDTATGGSVAMRASRPREYTEPLLLSLAHAYEQHYAVRQPPLALPPLN